MARTTATITSEDTVIEYEIEQPLVTVHIVDLNTGFKSTGHAKCDVTDRWEENFGLKLAHLRAMNRLTKKLERFYANTMSKYNVRAI